MTEKIKERLLDCSSGDFVEIIEIHLEGQDIIRLAGLGMVDGAAMRVMKNNGRGPIIIRVKQTRLALGHHEAKGIFVKAI
ncbi:MAG: ferrous iron transport protein A [Deltaproteobacteria bacterium]|nr:ferrous iron transport protein A [Deltaproteobacteria bacterium]